jgi:fatty-acyl-CoA synthase
VGDAPGATLFGSLVEAADDGGPPLWFHSLEGSERLDLGDLAERALDRAGLLAARGVEPGDRVGLLGGNVSQWGVCAFGAWARGATLVPLPFHLRIRDAEAFRSQLGRLVDAAGCGVVLAEERFLPYLPPETAVPWEEPAPLAQDAAGAVPVEATAVIQFTSGSTMAPRGVVLSHRAVLAGIECLRRGFRVTTSDRYCGWLPFFHDNGVFGFLVRPIVHRCEGHVLATDAFAADPSRWFRVIGERGVTITAGPSSGFAVALRAALRTPRGIDLSTLELVVLSAEMIEPHLVDRLEKHGPGLGLRAESLAGAYGLAEATLGVTVTKRGAGLPIQAVDLRSLAETGRAEPAEGAPAKRIASCGRPHPGIDIRIGSPTRPRPERTVGEVLVRAPSLMDGYLGEVTDETFVDGWLRTGDLGYLADGELYVTGRAKDIIVSVGRNYAPEDIEWAAARVPGVRLGRVIAFADPTGGEGAVIVMLEAREGADEAEVAAKVRRGVTDAVGLVLRRVVVVPHDTLPKTTSGKLRRSAAREAYLHNESTGATSR